MIRADIKCGKFTKKTNNMEALTRDRTTTNLTAMQRNAKVPTV